MVICAIVFSGQGGDFPISFVEKPELSSSLRYLKTDILGHRHPNAISLIRCFSQYTGTAESARACVREYFTRLRETLAAQEEVAITTLDSHVQSRVTALRRMHDDATALRSQISAALTHCNNVLRQVGGFCRK